MNIEKQLEILKVILKDRESDLIIYRDLSADATNRFIGKELEDSLARYESIKLELLVEIEALNFFIFGLENKIQQGKEHDND